MVKAFRRALSTKYAPAATSDDPTDLQSSPITSLKFSFPFFVPLGLKWAIGVVGKGCHSVFLQFRENFKSLRPCPRELYINFFLKFCESYSYFAVSQILVIYLHNEFQFSDLDAGTYYGLWGAAITLWGILTGWINDRLGVRRALLIGFVISTVSTFCLFLARSRAFVALILFIMLPIGNSIGLPMLTVGIRRYTTLSNRGFAFGLFYSVMNVAAFVSGPVVDLCNSPAVTSPHSTISGNRWVIFSACLTNFVSFVVAFFFLREVKIAEEEPDTTSPHMAVDEGEEKHCDEELADDCAEETVTIEFTRTVSSAQEIELTEMVRSPLGVISFESADEDVETGQTTSAAVHDVPSEGFETTRVVQDVVLPRQSPFRVISDICTSATFWRFTALSLLMINLKSLFRHLDATLPTYLIRAFGPNVPKGTIYSINPFMIMFLTPVVAAFTTKYKHFDMIKTGGYFAGVSPFYMACSTSITAVVLFVVTFSIGEAIWSPRVYDYTMSVAPEGKEATFAVMAVAPIFVAQVPVGLLSGYLISTYMPEDKSKQNGRMLWLIIGILAISSPILITLLERWIREPEKKPVNVGNESSSSSHGLLVEDRDRGREIPHVAINGAESTDDEIIACEEMKEDEKDGRDTDVTR